MAISVKERPQLRSSVSVLATMAVFEVTGSRLVVELPDGTPVRLEGDAFRDFVYSMRSHRSPELLQVWIASAVEAVAEAQKLLGKKG